MTPVQKAQPRPYFHGSLRSARDLIFVVPDLEERTLVLSSAAGKLTYTIRVYPKMWAPIAGKVGASAAEK